MTLDELVNAGFPAENFPEDLPDPGESNISLVSSEGDKELYRYEVEVDGKTYAMECVLDTKTMPNPAEGVTFMLNQFAYLWRTDKAKLEVDDSGSCRRISL